MDPEILPVTAEDGHRFEARLTLSDDSSAPILVFGPAMGTWGKFYDKLGATLSASGLSFVTFDWRGAASSNWRASRRQNWGYRELIELDYPALMDSVCKTVPNAAGIWTGGHSLGGQISALFAARNPDSTQGLLLVAAGSVYYRGWSGLARLKILGLTQSAQVIGKLVGHFPGHRMGFAGREARGVIADWARCARTGRYDLDRTDVDDEATLACLRLPALAIGMAGDGLAPEQSTRRLLDKLSGSDCSYQNLSAEDSGGTALDHFSWARNPRWVAPLILDWVRSGPAAAGSH